MTIKLRPGYIALFSVSVTALVLSIVYLLLAVGPEKATDVPEYVATFAGFVIFFSVVGTALAVWAVEFL